MIASEKLVHTKKKDVETTNEATTVNKNVTHQIKIWNFKDINMLVYVCQRRSAH